MIPTPTVNLDLARACCRASAQAYEVFPPTVETDLAHVVLVEPSGDLPLIIAFRGTASLHDVITDAEVGFNSWSAYKLGAAMRVRANETALHQESGMEVHRGFLQAFTSALDPLLAKLRERCADRPEQILTLPIVVTGHSLGGALAMLCAKSLSELMMNVQAVYTFGQPRVGNLRFCQSFDQAGPGLSKLKEKTFRFVNEEDPVPRVPGVLAGYRHAGNEVFLTALGPSAGEDTCPTANWILNPPLWRKVISDAWGIYRAWDKGGPLECLGDHKMAQYLRRVCGCGAALANDNQEEEKPTSKVL